MSDRKYVCSTCNKPTARDLLMAKKIVFLTMGAGGRTVKSRVIEWKCPTCVVKDEHWNLEAFVAPGSQYLRTEQQSSPATVSG